MSRDDWYRVIAGIRSTNLRGAAAMDEALCEIAIAWSRGDYTDGVTPGSYTSDEDGEHVFYSFDPDAAGGAHFGTIDHMARDRGFKGPPERDPKRFDTFTKNAGSTVDTPNVVSLAAHRTPDDQAGVEARLAGWRALDPRDPSEMPEIEFYDEGHTIPKIPTGCVKVYYGRRGEHKTNVVLSVLAGSTAQRILYAAGEGAYGLERDRISARPELKGRIKLLKRVPLFSQPDQVADFIEANAGGGFEIVVLDTMTNALAGEDTNTDIAASYLADNGPCGMIRRAFNCAVILVAHAGKDVSKGVKGSSGYEDNADVVELVEADKKAGCIRCTVKKMRDAPEDIVTYYRIEPSGVPVPVKITEAEFLRLTKSGDGNAPADNKQQRIISAIHRTKAHDHNRGLTDMVIAGEMTHAWGARLDWDYNPIALNKADAGTEGYEQWADQYHSDLQAVRNAHKAGVAWSKEYYALRTPNGGTDPEGRWFLPPDKVPQPESDDAVDEDF
jgi:hypothetical protein